MGRMHVIGYISVNQKRGTSVSSMDHSDNRRVSRYCGCTRVLLQASSPWLTVRVGWVSLSLMGGTWVAGSRVGVVFTLFVSSWHDERRNVWGRDELGRTELGDEQ